MTDSSASYGIGHAVCAALRTGRTHADTFVRKRLFLALTLALVSGALAAGAPVALKYAIDALGTDGFQVFSPGAFTDLDVSVGVSGLLLIYLAAFWVSRSFGELRWFLFGAADRRLHRNLSRHLLDHVLKLPMLFHADRKSGGLNQTLAQGLMGYSVLVNHLVFTLLPVFVEVVIIVTVLSFFQVEFIAIFIAAVAAYAVVFTMGVMQIIAPSRAVANSQVDAYASLTDILINVETVKYFTAEQRVGDRYDGTLARAESDWKEFYRRKSLNGLLVALVFVATLGAALFMGARHVMAGSMTIGDFVLINAYMLQIVRPMETLGAGMRDIVHGVAFIEKMTELLDQKTENTGRATVTSANDCVPTDETGSRTGFGELTFDKVTFSYARGRRVLSDISFTISPGKTVAIVGESGAGKSSLMRLLMRLYDPENGDIRLNGNLTRDMTVDALRRAVAVVPQDTALFNDTIAGNIALGNEDNNPADIERVARLAHLHDMIMHTPDGYQTLVGERGMKLSGGEKQRVAIARALLKEAQVIVLDEATSALDTGTEQEILDDLFEVSKGVTTLMIAHRLSTVRHADEILVLHEGGIGERGNHEWLIRQKGLYASMWARQQNKNEKRESAAW